MTARGWLAENGLGRLPDLTLPGLLVPAASLRGAPPVSHASRGAISEAPRARKQFCVAQMAREPAEREPRRRPAWRPQWGLQFESSQADVHELEEAFWNARNASQQATSAVLSAGGSAKRAGRHALSHQCHYYVLLELQRKSAHGPHPQPVRATARAALPVCLCRGLSGARPAGFQTALPGAEGSGEQGRPQAPLAARLGGAGREGKVRRSARWCRRQGPLCLAAWERSSLPRRHPLRTPACV